MRISLIGILFVSFSSLTAGPPENKSLTFRVSGVECGGCMYAVQQSISETPGVKDVAILPGIETLATVTFDSIRISEHQIAQSIREALPLHGTPYLASLKIKVSNETAPNIKQALDRLQEKWKNQIRIEPIDKESTNRLIHFEPLSPDAPKDKSHGWSMARFTEDANKAGIAVTLIGENQ
jgi:copper chaperone CopZ